MSVTQLCNKVNQQLLKLEIHDYKTTFVSWEDVGRLVMPSGKISVCAKKMNDVFAFLYDPATKKRTGTFVVRKDNLTDESAICSMSKLCCVTDSLKGGDAAMAKVSDVLKDFGKHFAHLGAKPDTNLLGSFTKVTLRVKVHILELKCDTEESLEEGNIIVSVNNYQSRPDAASCVNVMFTAQGVSACLDCSPPGKPVDMFLQGLSKDDQVCNFAIGVEAVAGRMFSQTGEQDGEEAQKQVEKGRAAEVKFINHPNMPKMCAVGHLCIPVKQKPMSAGSINVPALGNLLSACPEVAGFDVPIMDDDDEEEDFMPNYCSMSYKSAMSMAMEEDEEDEYDEDPGPFRSASGLRAPPIAVAPKETCKAASVHRGCEMDFTQPFQQTDLELDETCGIPTYTLSIFTVKDPEKEFGTDDVKNAIDLANRVLKCASDDSENAKPLNDKVFKEAGATVSSLTVDDAAKIAEAVDVMAKDAKKPRVSNIPVGIIF